MALQKSMQSPFGPVFKQAYIRVRLIQIDWEIEHLIIHVSAHADHNARQQEKRPFWEQSFELRSSSYERPRPTGKEPVVRIPSFAQVVRGGDIRVELYGFLRGLPEFADAIDV